MQAIIHKIGCCLFMLLSLILSLGAVSSPAYAQSLRVGAQGKASVRALDPDFSKFARSWTAHGATLAFSANGRAVFEQRVYTWCATGQQSPCDSIDTSGNIHPGHREVIQFLRISDDAAYGEVIASNFHQAGANVVARLQGDDTLLYSDQRAIALLCGPRTLVGACGA